MRTVDDVLRMAKSAGVTVLVEGYDLILEHEADPPPHLVAMLRHYKRELVGALRMREAEQRSLVAQWINNHFTSSPASVCAHCGGGPRPDDPFVLLFVGTDRARCTAPATRHGSLSARLRPAKLSALRPTQQVGTRNHQIQGLIPKAPLVDSRG